MANFKVIYRVDKASEGDDTLTWEPGCPLAFEAIQVSRDVDSGRAFLQAKVRNISDETAQSFKAILVAMYEDGCSEVVDIDSLDADIPAGSDYAIKPKPLNCESVKKIEASFEIVKFASGEWRSSSRPSSIPKPKHIELSERAKAERLEMVWGSSSSAVLSKAMQYAGNSLEDHDGWWLCPCGQPNVGIHNCVACGASLENLREFSGEDERLLEERASKREVAVLERRKKAQRKKHAVYAVLAAAVVAVVLVFAFVVMPIQEEAQRNAELESLYQRAMNDFEAERYEEARDRFVELSSYKDSEAMAAESYSRAYAVAQEELFNDNIAYFLDTNHAWIGGTLGIDEHGVYLGSDHTISVTIRGVAWTGTWSPETQEIHIDQFPYGEDWHFDGFSESIWLADGPWGDAPVRMKEVKIQSDGSDAYFDMCRKMASLEADDELIGY